MSERHQDIAKVGAWAVGELARRNDTTATDSKDVAYGQGQAIAFPTSGQDDAHQIEFFEESKVIRVTTPDARIELFRAAAPREARTGIAVENESGNHRLLFLRDGHVVFEIHPPTPVEPLESRVSPVANQDHMDALSSPAEPAVAGSEGVRRPSETTSSTPEQQERQPRVRIVGRLGDDPRFDTGRDGKARVNFPVHDQASDTWKKVYTTGERAEKVQQEHITKGDRVSVVGFSQLRDVQKRTKDGQTHTTTEERVFALGVKKMKNGQPDDGAET